MVNEFRTKAKITNPDIETILYGTKFKDRERNKIVVKIVHEYIKATKRFDMS